MIFFNFQLVKTVQVGIFLLIDEVGLSFLRDFLVGLWLRWLEIDFLLEKVVMGLCFKIWWGVLRSGVGVEIGGFEALEKWGSNVVWLKGFILVIISSIILVFVVGDCGSEGDCDDYKIED